MKKKVLVSFLILVSLFGTFISIGEKSVVVANNSKVNSILLEWGNYLNSQQKVVDLDNNNIESNDNFNFDDSISTEIFSDSEDLFTSKPEEIEEFQDVPIESQSDNNLYIIDEEELARATKFYELRGDSNPEELAYNYVMEQQALYIEAIENGFQVTDSEVWNYLDVLKIQLENANNSEDYRTIKSGFDSEADYWNFQFSVYKKSLPIKKYVTMRARDFANSKGVNVSSPEFQEIWNAELINITSNAVQKHFSDFSDGIVQ